MDKEYISSEYKRMHEKKQFSGSSLIRYLPEIKHLIKLHQCDTLLDYGCGKAIHHKKPLLKTVTLFDPYYEPYSTKPEGTFDIVICTDVLEHIPEDEIGKTLHELIHYTNKVLFLAISTVPAKKKFSNGENVHLTIKPAEWWESMLDTHRDISIMRIYS